MQKVVVIAGVIFLSQSLFAGYLTGFKYEDAEKSKLYSFTGERVYVRSQVPEASGKQCLYWHRKFKQKKKGGDEGKFASVRDHKFESVITIDCLDGNQIELGVTGSFWAIADGDKVYWRK